MSGRVRLRWSWLGPPTGALYAAGWVLIPLRLFLGFTFCFAGLQKLANPGFFDAADPASIQAQLSGAARLSPVHSLVAPLVHVAVPLGILIALAEVAVGLGAILGLWTRVAAAGGMILALMLFLTVSFHASPYYTGADIVFAFAWTPLLLAGSGGTLSVDALVAYVVRRRAGEGPSAVVPIAFATVRQVCGAYDKGACQARRGAPCEPVPCPFLRGSSMSTTRSMDAEMDRRTFAAKGTVAAAVALVGLVGGGLAAGIGRLAGGSPPKPGPRALGQTGAGPALTTVPPGHAAGSSTTTPVTATQQPSATTPSATTPSATRPPTPSPSTTRAVTEPAGKQIGPASQVPVGGSATFNDPRSGDPSLVIQPRPGTFVAFDAVCPHAGCTVGYESSDQVIICPCHGSRFNAQTGAVEQGPAATGLESITIAEGSDGQLYAV